MDKWIEDNQNMLFFRIHMEEKSKEQILEDLKEKYLQIIVSQESATRPHFHCLILHTDTNVKNAQQNLRNFLKMKWKLKGNGGYAITETKKGTSTRLGAYVVKDGNFCSYGISKDVIEGFKAVSYKKYTKNEFQEKLNKMREDFLKNDSDDIKDFIESYVRLKIAFNQNLNANTIVNYINLINAQKFGPSEIISSIFAKFNSQ